MLIFESNRIKYSFIISVISLTVVALCSSLPVPFYHTYQTLYNLNDSTLSIATFFYFTGDVITLLFLPRLSNYLGRKPVMVITLLFGLFSLVLFLLINNGFLLVFARLIQGIYCGISVSSIQTYVLDVSPKNSHLGIVLSANLPTVGFSLGSLLSGLIVDIDSSMMSSVFVFGIILFTVCIILTLFTEETINPKKLNWNVFKPRLVVTDNIRPFILISLLLFIATYALNGFYQTFSSSISFRYFHYSEKFMASVIYTSILIPQVFGGALINRFSIKNSMIYGILGFGISMVLVNIAMIDSCFEMFLIFNIVGAFFCGLCFTATMENILGRCSIIERSGVYALIYIMVDGGAALSNFLISLYVDFIGLINVSVLYSIFLLIIFVLLLFLSRNLDFKVSS